MHWEIRKSMWLAFLWYSLYCSGLEQNPQYLWGLPVIQYIYCFLRIGPNLLGVGGQMLFRLPHFVKITFPPHLLNEWGVNDIITYCSTWSMSWCMKDFMCFQTVTFYNKHASTLGITDTIIGSRAIGLCSHKYVFHAQLGE